MMGDMLICALSNDPGSFECSKRNQGREWNLLISQLGNQTNTNTSGGWDDGYEKPVSKLSSVVMRRGVPSNSPGQPVGDRKRVQHFRIR